MTKQDVKPAHDGQLACSGCGERAPSPLEVATCLEDTAAEVRAAQNAMGLQVMLYAAVACARMLRDTLCQTCSYTSMLDVFPELASAARLMKELAKGDPSPDPRPEPARSEGGRGFSVSGTAQTDPRIFELRAEARRLERHCQRGQFKRSAGEAFLARLNALSALGPTCNVVDVTELLTLVRAIKVAMGVQ